MTKITLLGTGTSTGVPHIGCKCEVCISTDSRDKRLRSSVLIETSDLNLLIDAGPDLRQQLLLHPVDSLSAVLITHEHYDHVGGLDDLRAFGDIDIYGEKNVLEAIRRNMPYCFNNNPYPGIPQLTLKEINETPFYINNTRIQPIRVLHGKLPILGFRIGKMAYLTDVKHLPESELEKLQDLDILILSALRQAPHFAHENLEEAIEKAGMIHAAETWFTHFSHDLGKHAQVSLQLPEGMKLAFDGLTLSL